jgi:hypothetical protein
MKFKARIIIFSILIIASFIVFFGSSNYDENRIILSLYDDSNLAQKENKPVYIAIALDGVELAKYSSLLPANINFIVDEEDFLSFKDDKHFKLTKIRTAEDNSLSIQREFLISKQNNEAKNQDILESILNNNQDNGLYIESEKNIFNEKLALQLFNKFKNKILLISENDKNSTLLNLAQKYSFKILTNDVILDSIISPGAIEEQLEKLELLALDKGFAIAKATAYPLTIEILTNWLEKAKEKGLVILPLDEFYKKYFQVEDFLQ